MMPAVIVQAKLTTQVIAGMRWLGRQTADPTATWEAWARGRPVPVSVGRDFVVVRLLGELGRAAVAELAADAPDLVGPVLVNDSVVEVFLPPTPAVWPGPGAELVDGRGASRATVKCPPPGREAERRRWLFPPRALPGSPAALTDPYRLVEAAAVARTGLQAAGYRLGP
ncbi:hypothetical protein ACFYUY_04510 [Kitasatospora sp. NPDC004745]|uniref:hypothetical protein n=1 Tax=Kitasatospora sp. NPDC004745 TaxID=3364019 RepID=UPI0036A64F53